MPNLREQLQQCFQGRVCLMGLGNVDYGDDGFGVRLAEALGDSGAASVDQSRYDSSVRSGMFIVAGQPVNQAPSGAACGRTPPREPAMPLLTELENDLAEPDGYRHAAPNGALRVVKAGTAPECFIGRIADEGFDHVIFLDAADFGAAPGAVVLLDSDEMAARFPQISTHKLSLGLLAKPVESNGRTKAWLLGVQPQSLKPGEQLSPTVNATLQLLLELMTDGSLVGRAEDCGPCPRGLEVMA